MIENVCLSLVGVTLVLMLVLARGAFVLASGIRRARREPPADPDVWPFVSLILPCKGAEANLAAHLTAHLQHEYPNYEVVFTVADADDPAVRVIRDVMAAHPAIPARLVIAPRLPNCVEKTSNQIAALAVVDPRTEVLAFADSDGMPLNRFWLRELVRPTLTGQVATGFRWYLPEDSAGRLHAAWDSSWGGFHIAFHTVWGGAMAVRRDVFERLQLADHWSRAVTDDLVVAREAWKAGVPVVFTPGAMSVSGPHKRVWSFVLWARRQTLLVRLTTPGFYRAGLTTGLLYLLGYAACLGLTWPLAGVGALLGATALRALGRYQLARTLLPGRETDVARTLWWPYYCFVPLADLIQAPIFLSVLWQRAIRWRGVTYRWTGNGVRREESRPWRDEE